MIGLNLDLLSVGMTAAGIGLLGFTIYFNGRRSITNKTFLGFALITILWSIANYFQYQPSSPEFGLWILRSIIFLGCWHAFTFFQLCFVFPEESVEFKRWYTHILVPIVGVVSSLTLTPLVFQSVTATTDSGAITQIQNGPAIPVFGMMVLALIIGGIYHLVRKTIKRTGVERKQIALMAFGMFVTFVCIVSFNLILPAVFNNPRFLPLSALFIFPFIACTAYAIFRYHMLEIKVLATEVVAFLLSVATLAQVLFSEGWIEALFHSSVFALVLGFSILMVQSVIKEVALRAELEIANRQQESLLHFISHEVKGYLTKNEAAFAAVAAGDFGKVEPELQSMSEAALVDTRKGVATVMDILDASNLRRGTVSYKKNTFDLVSTVAEIVKDLEGAAKEKGLALEFKKPVTGAYNVEGDEDKIQRHVIRNVIDNSIKYTPSGSVSVELSRHNGLIHLVVADTGVGITQEDMHKLFTEGGHGTDSVKINVHSTGYGLYIAKSIVEAHGGKIWAESDGKDKGSQFIIELPEFVASID